MEHRGWQAMSNNVKSKSYLVETLELKMVKINQLTFNLVWEFLHSDWWISEGE